MTKRLLLTVPLVSLFIACGPPKRSMSLEPTAAPKPAETAVATEEPKEEEPAEEKKPEKKKKAKKPKKVAFHWKDYAGPKATTKITTKKAWAVIPVGLDGDFSIVKTALLDYVKAEGEEHVLLRMPDEPIYVPQAMVQPATPAASVKKGAAMFVNVAAASGFGRATDVTKGEGGELDRVKFKYEWAGQVSEDELPIDQVIVLEDKIAFGHPVSFPAGADREVGTVIYTDKDVTWVITSSGQPGKTATKDVKPMKVSKVLKKGDKVLAPAPFQIKPGKVTDVLDDGTRYKVKPDGDGQEQTLSFQLVSAL